MSKAVFKAKTFEKTHIWWRRTLQVKAFFALAVAVSLFLSSLARAEAPLCSAVFGGNANGSFVYFGNQIQNHLESLLLKSTRSIDLELSLDMKSPLFKILIAKANAGVKIRMVLDNRDAYKELPRQLEWQEMLRTLDEAGIDVAVSDSKDLSDHRAFPRSFLHRKIVIVDERHFYVGSSNFSRNIGNVEIGYFGKMHEQASLQSVFRADYEASGNAWKGVKPSSLLPDAEMKRVSLVGPGTENPDFQRYILAAIDKAQNHIVMSAFEASDLTILQALIKKKEQNPQMRIQVLLSSGQSQIYLAKTKFQIEKNTDFKAKLQNTGIEVREYSQPKSLNHSRMIIADDLVYGSSADFTQRAFKGSVELGFALKSEAMSKATLENFDAIWKASANLQQAGLKERLITAFFEFYDQVTIWVVKTKQLMRAAH